MEKVFETYAPKREVVSDIESVTTLPHVALVFPSSTKDNSFTQTHQIANLLFIESVIFLCVAYSAHLGNSHSLFASVEISKSGTFSPHTFSAVRAARRIYYPG